MVFDKIKSRKAVKSREIAKSREFYCPRICKYERILIIFFSNTSEFDKEENGDSLGARAARLERENRQNLRARSEKFNRNQINQHQFQFQNFQLQLLTNLRS